MPSSSDRREETVVDAVIAGRPWVYSSIKEPTLRNAARALGRTFQNHRASIEPLREPCRRLVGVILRRSCLLRDSRIKHRELVPALLRFCHYSPQWLRTPEDWHPCRGDVHEQWVDLIDHLFVKWPMPPFFHNAWRKRGALACRERDWFCALARGGSWRKVEGLPDGVTSRALHHAMGAPADVSVIQAIRYGQVIAAGGSPELAAEVMASRMAESLEHGEYWVRLVEKTSRAEGFDPRDFGVIADQLGDDLRRTYWYRVGRLLELPLRELLSHCRRHWRDCLQVAELAGLHFRVKDFRCPGLRESLSYFSTARWARMVGVGPCDWVEGQGKASESRTCIVERTSHADLIVEGREMGHCVAGYGRACEVGGSAIFSMWMGAGGVPFSARDERLTIQVVRKSRRIVQIKGRWNREPYQDEMKVIRQWAVRNKLELFAS